MPYNSGSIANFSASAISDTYQRIVQTDGVSLADGTGSILSNLTFPNLNISGNLYVSGTLYAENTITVTQSYYSGSNIFGDQLTDTHQFTGSILSTGSNVFNGSNTFIGLVSITGSLNVSGSITGSLFGTASYALTASYVNPLNQNVLITGSLDISNQNGTSPFLIKSGSLPVLTVTGSGVTVLGTFASPPPVASGGIYFDGTDFYLGV